MSQFNFENFPSVSMATFLRDYVGEDACINDETARKLAKATHKDLKELNIPYVKSVPFEILTTDDLCMGKYILVYDGKSTQHNKRIAPYVRPSILKEQEQTQEADEFEEFYDEEIKQEINEEKGRGLIL